MNAAYKVRYGQACIYAELCALEQCQGQNCYTFPPHCYVIAMVKMSMHGVYSCYKRVKLEV